MFDNKQYEEAQKYFDVIVDVATEIRSLIQASDISKKYSYHSDTRNVPQPLALLMLIISAAQTTLLVEKFGIEEAIVIRRLFVMFLTEQVMGKEEYTDKITVLNELYQEICKEVWELVVFEKKNSTPQFALVAQHTLLTLFHFPEGRKGTDKFVGLIIEISQKYQELLPKICDRMSLAKVDEIVLNYYREINSDATEVRNLIKETDISRKYLYAPDLSSQSMLSLILCAAHTYYLGSKYGATIALEIQNKFVLKLSAGIQKGKFKDNFIGLHDFFTEIYVRVIEIILEEQDNSKPAFLFVASYTLERLFYLPKGMLNLAEYADLVAAITLVYQRILPTICDRI